MLTPKISKLVVVMHPVTPAFRKWRQEDQEEFKNIPDQVTSRNSEWAHAMRPCFKNHK